MQDEIVARLANGIEGQSWSPPKPGGRQRRQTPTQSISIFKARLRVNKGHTLEYLSQARGFFERALTLDPGDVEALIGSASLDVDIAGHV